MILSIIIPTYNRKKLLTFTLDSLSLEDGIEKEVIVVDDGSTDGTEALVKAKYPGVRFIKQNQQGAPAARNLGIKEARGEYIVFLDSDDLLEEGYVESKLKSFGAKTQMDAIYGPWDFFKSDNVYNPSDIVPRFSKYPLYNEGQEFEIMRNLLGGWYIPTSTVMWKKSFLEKIGGFRSDLSINQDVDLIFRAIVGEGKIIGEKGPRALIREHNSDRVGVVKNDLPKLKQIFELRHFFINELKVAGKWDKKYAIALGEYSFDMWALYRKELPAVAKKFLDLSKSLNPDLEVKGGVLYQMLGKAIGSHRAVIIKQAIKF